MYDDDEVDDDDDNDVNSPSFTSDVTSEQRWNLTSQNNELKAKTRQLERKLKASVEKYEDLVATIKERGDVNLDGTSSGKHLNLCFKVILYQIFPERTPLPSECILIVHK